MPKSGGVVKCNQYHCAFSLTQVIKSEAVVTPEFLWEVRNGRYFSATCGVAMRFSWGFCLPATKTRPKKRNGIE
jgi:hypothetical protein